jgi:hypothetical protein
MVAPRVNSGTQILTRRSVSIVEGGKVQPFLCLPTSNRMNDFTLPPFAGNERATDAVAALSRSVV